MSAECAWIVYRKLSNTVLYNLQTGKLSNSLGIQPGLVSFGNNIMYVVDGLEIINLINLPSLYIIKLLKFS